MKLDLPKERVEDFCRRWRITEMALFGSVLRDTHDVSALIERIQKLPIE